MPLLKPAVACVVAALLFVTLQMDSAPDSPRAGSLTPIPVGIYVGGQLAPEDVHVVTEPGRYGLGPQLRGSQYGIAGGQLIRFDPESFQVQSILRRQARHAD